MLVLHHLHHSRSQRILWLLEELGLDYEVRHYPRNPRTELAPASLKTAHPLGKAPVLTDGATVVVESGAIIEYLIERYGEGALRPVLGTPEHLRYRQWLHYAEGSLMPPLLLELIFNRLDGARVPAVVRLLVKAITRRVRHNYITTQLQAHLAYLDEELGKTPWFAGAAFSGADIQMIFPIEAVALRPDFAHYPNLRDWLRRCHARPAWKRALSRGGPFRMLR